MSYAGAGTSSRGATGPRGRLRISRGLRTRISGYERSGRTALPGPRDLVHQGDSFFRHASRQPIVHLFQGSGIQVGRMETDLGLMKRDLQTIRVFPPAVRDIGLL